MPDIKANLHEKFAKLPYSLNPTLAGSTVSPSSYNPICFTRFGGKAGKLLPSLSRVHGTLNTTIVFSYEPDDGHPLRSWPVGYEYKAASEPSFEIDSKGGERFVRAVITMEAVKLKPNEDLFIHGVLSAAAFITNRGREYKFYNYGPQYGGDLIDTELEFPPLERITGIYGVPD
ncbi:unnamed protein product [Clonostachys rosea]|uniref:Uncharacterized protein n=1 Tax=Bionectria ochroleuca TaxID=29856 RepID=A0ABY6UHC1_BIOOC|nr:unnamed protein product [Clonostachys rosea]